MPQAENWLYVEMMLDHGSCNALLKARDEDSTGELFLLFLLLIQKCRIVCAVWVGLESECWASETWIKRVHWHSHHGGRVC